MNIQKAFTIKGMTCGNCVRHVEKAIQTLPGVEQIQVTLEQHQAVVNYDPDLVTTEAMATALKEAGYTMEELVR